MTQECEMNGDVLLIKLRMNMNSFSKKERVIAEYVLDHFQDVSTVTIGSLAQTLELSPGLIVRFCKKLGFQGFPEFKQALGSVQGEQSHLPVLGDHPADVIVNSTFKNAILTIEDTLRINTLQSFDQAAHLIVNASRVVFFGSGGSARIAENATRNFVRWKPSVAFHRDSKQQLHSARNLTADCVGIGISYSGETATVVNCLAAAKENNAKTVSITSSERSSLAEVSDIVFLAAMRGDEMFNENEFSKIAQTVILDAVYYCFINRLKQA